MCKRYKVRLQIDIPVGIFQLSRAIELEIDIDRLRSLKLPARPIGLALRSLRSFRVAVAPWRSLRSLSGRLRLPARRLRLLALRALAHAPRRLRLLGMAFGRKCGGSAPTPRPRSRQSPAPASPSAPRATYRTQSQPVQFGNECRIRFPVDRDTGIQSTLHRIPLEGHRIEDKTFYRWDSTVFSLIDKTGS